MPCKQEQRAQELLRLASRRAGNVVNLTMYPNVTATRKWIAIYIQDYPHLLLLKRRIVWRRHALQYMAKCVIWRNRRRINALAQLVKKAVLHSIVQQMEQEYRDGIRIQDTCSALCKAEAAIYDVSPTIAAFKNEACP
jgi:hypothetical protein